MLLDSSALPNRWTKLLTTASRVDIAVAWLTSKERTDDLLSFAGMPGHHVRVIAGVRDYLTSPECLHQLFHAGVLKIGVGVHRYTFHPKLYIFTLSDSTVCWVGSANLTTSGFGGNTEVIHEYDDNGTTAACFASMWDSFEYPTNEWLTEYEQRAKAAAPIRNAIDQMPPPARPNDPLESWSAYFHALRRADKEWMANSDGKFGIFSGENSYLTTIRSAQPLITTDWAILSTTDACVLLGLTDNGADYGLLGSMKGAGIANNVFLKATPKNMNTRLAIQDEITRLRKAPLDGAFPLTVRRAFEVITNRAGFSFGVATRLLALTRPEVLVSVNSESVDRLAQLSGLPVAMIKTSLGYEKLVKWIMKGKWWNCFEPLLPLEREAWSYRAALIDALIYPAAPWK